MTQQDVRVISARVDLNRALEKFDRGLVLFLEGKRVAKGEPGGGRGLVRGVGEEFLAEGGELGFHGGVPEGAGEVGE